jgi:hypothetical protein
MTTIVSHLRSDEMVARLTREDTVLGPDEVPDSHRRGSTSVASRDEFERYSWSETDEARQFRALFRVLHPGQGLQRSTLLQDDPRGHRHSWTELTFSNDP